MENERIDFSDVCLHQSWALAPADLVLSFLFLQCFYATRFFKKETYLLVKIYNDETGIGPNTCYHIQEKNSKNWEFR